jgi:exopolysaccharide biosynthesis protein
MPALLLVVLLLSSPALAGEEWTTPFAGVRKVHLVTRDLQVHALEIHLDHPGVSLRSTASGERKQAVSAFAKGVGAQLAINADFFSYADYATAGLSAGNGVAWDGTSDGSDRTAFAFGADNRVSLAPMESSVRFEPEWMKGVVSGGPDLVRDGRVAALFSSFRCFVRHPRTALGLSRDQKTLYLVVVDGRSAASVGMTCAELAALLQRLGAWTAFNLDGGGSSTMYLEGLGVVNQPSDGRERVVGNHLAVFAPKNSEGAGAASP